MADKYLKEDGSGGYELEDGTGVYLLETSAPPPRPSSWMRRRRTQLLSSRGRGV